MLYILQRPNEAATQAQLAFDLDPLNPIIQVTYSAALLFAGDCETPLALMDKLLEGDPGFFLAYDMIEAAAFYCRDYNKVMEAAKYLWAKEVDFKEVERIFGETGFVAANEEILRQLEVLAQKGYFPPVGMAIRYMMVDQPD